MKTKKTKSIFTLEQQKINEAYAKKLRAKKECPAVEMAKRIRNNAKWSNVNLGIKSIPMSMYIEVLNNIIKAK